MRRFMSSTVIFRLMTTAGLVALAAGCGGQEQGEPAADDMGGMPGMSPPGGEPMGDMGGGMMDQMGTHLNRMATVPADSLMDVLPTHRQMVANMLSQMNREMRDMNMTTDAAWNAMVDSLRSDLIRMPGMGAAELVTLMPGHRERVQRLMSMHAAMLGPLRM
ncbi:MAG TPA: hypothetical protein VM198_00340 [Longimicrobiales bacterium]|nr:hypothetical protein [Longimicrobiales bacterium]